MSAPQTIFVAVIGVGGVGQAFLGQLGPLQQRLAAQPTPIDLRLILARRSRTQVFDDTFRGLDISTVAQQLEASPQPLPELPALLDRLASAPGPVVLVDNTSDLGVARAYPAALQRGLSVVTPNKKAFSDTDALWTAIFGAARNGAGPARAGRVFHEASVGAGLPVLSTLRELLDTGDAVTRVEGVFSGTMSFLFNAFMPVGGAGAAAGEGFGAAVATAQRLGYTEPDPRDDLNGLDVARKLTILARMAGLPVPSPTAFPVESLIPPELEACASGAEFVRRLPEFDARMDARRAAAAAEGKVVRFVGSIDVAAKAVRVGLEAFDVAHPIAALQGSDNIISFYTRRYGDNPLIIQGAGAGAEVTAMGVTGDLLKVIRLLERP